MLALLIILIVQLGIDVFIGMSFISSRLDGSGEDDEDAHTDKHINRN